MCIPEEIIISPKLCLIKIAKREFCYFNKSSRGFRVNLWQSYLIFAKFPIEQKCRRFCQMSWRKLHLISEQTFSVYKFPTAEIFCRKLCIFFKYISRHFHCLQLRNFKLEKFRNAKLELNGKLAAMKIHFLPSASSTSGQRCKHEFTTFEGPKVLENMTQINRKLLSITSKQSASFSSSYFHKNILVL